MKHFLAQPLVRALLVGVVVIAAASALKLYADRDFIDPEVQRAQIDEHLLDLHSALKDALSDAQDRDAAIQQIPETVPWLPSKLLCHGKDVTPSTDDAAAWKELGWPLITQETPRPYAYQITMRRHHSRITWIARRDVDCDGIYEIHTLHGDLGWGDAFKATHVETQNMNE